MKALISVCLWKLVLAITAVAVLPAPVGRGDDELVPDRRHAASWPCLSAGSIARKNGQLTSTDGKMLQAAGSGRQTPVIPRACRSK